jgi:hypothetical protein
MDAIPTPASNQARLFPALLLAINERMEGLISSRIAALGVLPLPLAIACSMAGH